MFRSLLILGRQPALGLAELESFFGPSRLQPVNAGMVFVDAAPHEIPIARFGGATKVTKFLTELHYTDWAKLQEFLETELPKHTCCVVDGKIRLGLNTHGFNVSPAKLNALGLTLKKAVKAGGRPSVRVVPNKSNELNAAQIIHNQLTGPTGFDIWLIRNGDKTILAQTVSVQDIDAYAARDQERPKRDARVGMLPPKLAQIIINLASTVQTDTSEKPLTLLDPFCGTGVILQEAMLMGYEAYGTDLEPRMIEYSQANLDWLKHEVKNFRLDQGDATIYQWQDFDVIACETYLGRPFSASPAPHVLQEVMQDVDTIHKKFLRNVAEQTTPGFRMTIAVPAWKTPQGFKHLKTLDNLEEMGYNRMKFVHVDDKDLVYHREGQVVARELVTLIRK